MLKGYQTELDPTPEQALKIRQTIGVCRVVYNMYLDRNKEIYETEKRFVSANEFSKWLNNVYLPDHSEKSWIKDVSAKSVKESLRNAETAFKRFFQHKSEFPKYKKKDKDDPSMYFVRNGLSQPIQCERYRIWIPTLGWVRLKEKGYIPSNSDDHTIHSGAVSMQAGRYYVAVAVEEAPDIIQNPNRSEGLGLDVGIKDFIIASDGMLFSNINKTKTIRKLEKKLKRLNRSLARKYKYAKSLPKGTATYKNIDKLKRKIQRIYQRLTNIRTNYRNQCINQIIQKNPQYIAIENLNVKDMMKNKHLAKSIQDQCFGEFRKALTEKCKEYGIELRIVDRFYPSSKTCHHCGYVKKDLKLSERTYKCPCCGMVINRDYNASLNIRDTNSYEISE